MKKIFLTVDVECHDYDAVNQYIWGQKGDVAYGLRRILDIGKELGIIINFFFDVSECRRYGDEYATSIIELIKSYNQPVWFHLHPNYITGNDQEEKTYLWSFDKQAQEKIFREGLIDYKRLCGYEGRLVYRAGRYGVNEDSYEAMFNVEPNILDLSYAYHSHDKMCHLPNSDVGVYNIPTQYKGITIMPNTSYIGFDYCGNKHTFLLNCAQTPYLEFKDFIRCTNLSNIVYTMHVWDFITKWFFLKKIIWGNQRIIKRFKKCVEFAKINGFEFSSLEDFHPTMQEEDDFLNLTLGVKGKIKSLVNNIVRFYDIGRLSPKFFFIMHLLPVICIILVVTILFVF